MGGNFLFLSSSSSSSFDLLRLFFLDVVVADAAADVSSLSFSNIVCNSDAASVNPCRRRYDNTIDSSDGLSVLLI